MRFNPPPNWPKPPTGWEPPSGWRPDPSWGPAPNGWNLWVDDGVTGLAKKPSHGEVAFAGKSNLSWPNRFPPTQTHDPNWTPPMVNGQSAHSQTNGMAIAALICAVLVPPLGILLGAIAQSQIRKTNEGGTGLAKAAIILGIVLFVAPLLVGLLVFSGLIVMNNQDAKDRLVQPQTVTATTVLSPP